MNKNEGEITFQGWQTKEGWTVRISKEFKVKNYCDALNTITKEIVRGDVTCEKK